MTLRWLEYGMNTTSVTETKAAFSVKDALSKAVPESIAARIFFWGALPSFLLLFDVGVGFLSASSISFYLPFLAIAGGVLCLRWKSAGLWGSYLALGLLLLFFYKDIPFEERLWQMGVVFALAVNFFILLLSSEEIESLISQTSETGRIKANELMQTQLSLQQLNQEKEELQKSFEEEIRRLKEEAEARKIERQQESKRIDLIQSEIEMLTTQKAYFVAEAKKARAIIEQDDQTQKILQDAQEKIESLEVRLYELSEQLELSRASKEELNAQVAALTEGIEQASTFRGENAALQDRIFSLTEKLNRAEIESEKLHLAISEKEAALSHFEKVMEEKQALQARVATLAEELKLAESVKETELAELAEKLSRSESDSEEKKILQAQVAALAEAENRIKEALLFAQDKAMTLQVSPVIKVDDKKIRQLEGLYKQLQDQFEEKARVLSQTRKDLFHTEGKLLAFEHEKELSAVTPNHESAYFEKEFCRLAAEIASLEEEVAALEDLTSSLFY